MRNNELEGLGFYPFQGNIFHWKKNNIEIRYFKNGSPIDKEDSFGELIEDLQLVIYNEDSVLGRHDDYFTNALIVKDITNFGKIIEAVQFLERW